MKASRHSLLLVLLWAALGGGWLSAAGTSSTQQQLNVLLIAADDLNVDLGCYGNPWVKTPNIDRLARGGVRFHRAYCQYALCNPSRTSFLSGLSPQSTRVFTNETPPRSFLGEKSVWLPEYFAQHGYFTARAGKIADARNGDPVHWQQVLREEEDTTRARHSRDVQVSQGKAPISWGAVDARDEELGDGSNARAVARLIEEKKGTPFLIGVGFHKPHEPFVVPRKYIEMYSPEKITLPKAPPDDRNDIPPLSLRRNRPDPVLRTDQEWRSEIAAYYATISYMDAQVGVVLDALERAQLMDKTIVVFLGDNGLHLGEHGGLQRKTSLFEQAARVPLIIRAPGAKGNGQTCTATVELLGLYPTLVELCGLPAREGLEGKSLVPLLNAPRTPWGPAFTFLVWDGVLGRSVRTDRFRYSEWDGGRQGAELYDHETDPQELNNLAEDAAHRPTREQLHQLLQQTKPMPTDDTNTSPAQGKGRKKAKRGQP